VGWIKWLAIGAISGFCEHGNEHSRSIDAENYLTR
jgi:hypothetical protein